MYEADTMCTTTDGCWCHVSIWKQIVTDRQQADDRSERVEEGTPQRTNKSQWLCMCVTSNKHLENLDDMNTFFFLASSLFGDNKGVDLFRVFWFSYSVRGGYKFGDQSHEKLLFDLC